MSGRWRAAMAAAVLCSFAIKLTLALNTYGATDVLFWEADRAKIRAEGVEALYRDGAVLYRNGAPYFSEEFNHPPFMARMLSFWDWLESVSGWPLRFWMRLSATLADVAGLLLLYRIIQRSSADIQKGSLLLVAASPVYVLVSGFHGNTDPIVVAFVLLAVYLLVSRRPHWLAGAALGMALNFKIMPLIFVPAMLFSIEGPRKRLEFAAGAGAIFWVASMPLIVQDPLVIARHVFGYNPQAGIWGLSRFAAVGMTAEALAAWAGGVKFGLLVVLVLTSAWMRFRRAHFPPMELQIGLLAFLFLALTPGFGVQYLAWLVPWTALLTFRQALAFHMTSGVFLFSYYNRGAQGLPWYLANSAATPVWYGSVVYLGLLCWLTICWLTVVYWRRVRLS